MSERGISAAMKTAVGASVVAPLVLFKADFPSGVVRAWTGIGELVVGGETYTGLGGLLEVEPAGESADGSAQSLRLQVSGFTPEIFDPVLLEGYQGRPLEMLFAVADVATGEVLGTPYTLYSGVMETDEVRDDGATASVELRAGNVLSDLLRPRNWRYTHEHQQRLYSGDKGLEFVAAMQEVEVKWGTE